MEKAKKITQEEFEKEVVKLAKQGLTSEKIGQKLKEEGIHTKNFKIKVSQILKQNNLYEQPDLKNVGNKLEAIKSHFEKNPQDKKSKREKDRVFSQLRKLKIYHKLI